jgi:hypothetical protein
MKVGLFFGAGAEISYGLPSVIAFWQPCIGIRTTRINF